jgi:hypothetical protein
METLAEYGDPGRMQQYRELSGKTIREGLLDIASLFGKLRLVNAREGLSVPFSKSLSPWKYVHEKTWTVDATRLLSDFANLAGKSLQDITTLVNPCPSAPRWKLVQSHDAIEILAIGFRFVIGRESFSASRLCSALRLAYQDNQLTQTTLYSEIKRWEATRGITIIRI